MHAHAGYGAGVMCLTAHSSCSSQPLALAAATALGALLPLATLFVMCLSTALNPTSCMTRQRRASPTHSPAPPTACMPPNALPLVASMPFLHASTSSRTTAGMLELCQDRSQPVMPPLPPSAAPSPVTSQAATPPWSAPPATVTPPGGSERSPPCFEPGIPPLSPSAASTLERSQASSGGVYSIPRHDLPPPSPKPASAQLPQGYCAAALSCAVQLYDWVDSWLSEADAWLDTQLAWLDRDTARSLLAGTLCLVAGGWAMLRLLGVALGHWRAGHSHHNPSPPANLPPPQPEHAGQQQPVHAAANGNEGGLDTQPLVDAPPSLVPSSEADVPAAGQAGCRRGSWGSLQSTSLDLLACPQVLAGASSSGSCWLGIAAAGQPMPRRQSAADAYERLSLVAAKGQQGAKAVDIPSHKPASEDPGLVSKSRITEVMAVGRATPSLSASPVHHSSPSPKEGWEQTRTTPDPILRPETAPALSALGANSPSLTEGRDQTGAASYPTLHLGPSPSPSLQPDPNQQPGSTCLTHLSPLTSPRGGRSEPAYLARPPLPRPHSSQGWDPDTQAVAPGADDSLPATRQPCAAQCASPAPSSQPVVSSHILTAISTALTVPTASARVQSLTFPGSPTSQSVGAGAPHPAHPTALPAAADSGVLPAATYFAAGLSSSFPRLVQLGWAQASQVLAAGWSNLPRSGSQPLHRQASMGWSPGQGQGGREKPGQLHHRRTSLNDTLNRRSPCSSSSNRAFRPTLCHSSSCGAAGVVASGPASGTAIAESESLGQSNTPGGLRGWLSSRPAQGCNRPRPGSEGTNRMPSWRGGCPPLVQRDAEHQVRKTRHCQLRWHLCFVEWSQARTAGGGKYGARALAWPGGYRSSSGARPGLGVVWGENGRPLCA
ncbi:hypothetical protein HaLaN_06124 [Haematococcus lacustris]|uniref:Uncharacterized protein n=1 Tax=Haematococcus lacustris TaxID=44745 RepID=A0A699YVB4_HAELA|nr:hypothetical protein HaLaN_06124 [Haematococcus lacustris]